MPNKEVIKVILSDPIIKPIIINQDLVLESLYRRDGEPSILPAAAAQASMPVLNANSVPKDIFEFYDKMDQDDNAEVALNKSKVVQLEIYKDQTS